jgi:serine/threonine-protein kinase RsbW
MMIADHDGNPATAALTTPFARGKRRCWRALLYRVEEMAPVLGEVAAALESLGYAAEDRHAVRLALDEAIVNGLRHGNRGDAAKCVRLRCYVGPELMVAEVEDEGPGFNPAVVPDPNLPENFLQPGGRGVMIMRHYMSWVHFSERGNCVTMGKCRSR